MVVPASSSSSTSSRSWTDAAARFLGRGHRVALSVLLLGGMSLLLYMTTSELWWETSPTTTATSSSRTSSTGEVHSTHVLSSSDQPSFGLETTSPSGQSSPQSSRLRFVFHVGPPKTGTTTLQQDFVREGFAEALRRDNYVYTGKETLPNPIQNVPLVLKLMNPPCRDELQRGQSDGPCWSSVQDILQGYRDQQTHVLLSSEDLSFRRTALHQTPEFISEIVQTWRDELDWDVHVVLAYRRYGEWALSALKQKHGHPTGGCLHRGWETPCPAPWREISAWMHRDPPSANQYVYTAQVLERWKNAGAPFTLLNFHARNSTDIKNHITTKFFCEAMDGTMPHACQYARQRQQEQLQAKQAKSSPQSGTAANVRSASSYLYDSIVLAVERLGWLDRTRVTREEATAELAHYHQHVLGRSVADLPLLCPPQSELEELLNISLRYEAQLLPDFYHSPFGEKAHRAAFWKIANDKKEFCSVDTEALLRHATSWQDLLDRAM